jgi:hypothetical protein
MGLTQNKKNNNENIEENENQDNQDINKRDKLIYYFAYEYGSSFSNYFKKFDNVYKGLNIKNYPFGAIYSESGISSSARIGRVKSDLLNVDAIIIQIWTRFQLNVIPHEAGLKCYRQDIPLLLFIGRGLVPDYSCYFEDKVYFESNKISVSGNTLFLNTEARSVNDIFKEIDDLMKDRKNKYKIMIYDYEIDEVQDEGILWLMDTLNNYN